MSAYNSLRKKNTTMKKVLVLLALLCTAVSMSAKPKKQMALQLYSIREVIGTPELYAKNHVEVFKKLAAWGYTAVEAANYDQGRGTFYGVTPQQFRADCEAAGLECLSSHATRGLTGEELKNHDFTEALKWWDKAIADHKAAGMSYIVTPGWGTPKTLEEAQTLCDYTNAIGRKCQAAGLRYGYHTHSHEYQKVGDVRWIDFMMQHTDPNVFFWQMDTYWCVMGQQSPVEYFKRYPGRFRMLHIKDLYELGQSGMLGFDAIFRAADTAGLDDYVVEMEGTDGTIDIMEGVRRCAEFLSKSKFVRKSYR
ncbi:MAG: sugar phosphate isomerase/epimerase [Bacteroidaceae bacterium]|nr:sugar phosphate isomerase/epimerase [Bacteroidaceae bacterium]